MCWPGDNVSMRLTTAQRGIASMQNKQGVSDRLDRLVPCTGGQPPGSQQMCTSVTDMRGAIAGLSGDPRGPSIRYNAVEQPMEHCFGNPQGDSEFHAVHNGRCPWIRVEQSKHSQVGCK